MFGIDGIEAVEFGPGVPGVELPVDGGSGGVALGDQGLNLPPESILAGEPLPQAGTRQYAELNLRHSLPRT